MIYVSVGRFRMILLVSIVNGDIDRERARGLNANWIE